MHANNEDQRMSTDSHHLLMLIEQ